MSLGVGFMCKNLAIVVGVCICSLWVSVCCAQWPEVPSEAVEALGVTPGTPKRNGFVFIEGRYIPPPYTVSRKGNAIFINRMQVEQPISWSAEKLTPVLLPPPAKTETPKKVEPAKPSLFEGTPETPVDIVVRDPAVAASVPTSEVQVGKTLDTLFDEPVTNGTFLVDKKGTASNNINPVVLTQKQKDELRQKLDMVRARFEMGLTQGEIYFFNPKFGRVNGTYGTAKALFYVLPEALRYSQSPQDLMVRLRQGGVSFLDINTCSDLYRNKLSFMVLSDRRRAIELYEETKKRP